VYIINAFSIKYSHQC